MLRLNRLSRINIVTTTKQGRTPGRPRQFDAEQAIETAQRLFHARGYDAVSVADLTQAFGINPPSFYAAFGSKLGLYTRVLQRYSQTGAIPIDALLRDDQPVAASLIAVLQEAARRYVADPAAAGCLVQPQRQTQGFSPKARCFTALFYCADAKTPQFTPKSLAFYPVDTYG